MQTSSKTSKSKGEIEKILSQEPRTDLSKEFSKASGVALLLSGSETNPELLFIKRALNPLDHWSGHLAFPGGKKDERDPDLLATCLREVREEVGVLLHPKDLIGSLDDLQARKRGHLLEFYIQPFVFFLPQNPPLILDPREVEKTYWIPLSYLMDERHRTEYQFDFSGNELHLPGIRFPDGSVLWGLTFAMIENFFRKLKKGS